MLIRTLIFAMLLCLAATLPASAQYAARRSGDTIQLEDTKNQMVVTLIPSAGNITSEFKVKGQNVLRWPYASMEDFKTRRGLNGIPFLAPWANRLDEQAFYANGKKYAFDMQLGNVNGAHRITAFPLPRPWKSSRRNPTAQPRGERAGSNFFDSPTGRRRSPSRTASR